MLPRNVTIAIPCLFACWLAACFNPDYPSGLACDPTGWCPPGQTCSVRNICSLDGDALGAGDGGLGDAPGADAGLGDLVSISIGDDVTLAVGAMNAFAVTGTYENGSQIIEEFAIWESSDNNIMFVDFNGVATAAAVGVATATCRFQGRVDSAQVTVVAP